VAPQVGVRETHQRLLKISFVAPKRLFQHYLPEAVIGVRSDATDLLKFSSICLGEAW
jgi:hypothetical protein